MTNRFHARAWRAALTATLLACGAASAASAETDAARANNASNATYPAHATRATPLDEARQLVLVTAEDWQSTTATLRRFERASTDRGWIAVASPIPVNLGRNGLAWGRGLHPDEHRRGPVKREGDGRAPAGVFRLSAAFGDANALPALESSAKLPYWPVTTDLKCIDDPASAHYNQLVDTRQGIPVDGLSHEDMRRDDGQYAVGIVVEHNATLPLVGAGSCIFIHVWRAPDAPTAGCTAGDRDQIVTLFSWLDAARQPVLVQLPEREYRHYRRRWALPR